MKRTVLPLLVVGLLAAPGIAEETFSLKFKQHSRGDVVQVSEKEVEKGKTTCTVLGITKSSKDEKGRTTVYREEIIEKEPGQRWTKIKRTYEKAEMTSDSRNANASFAGKSVLIERTAAGYKFSINGEELEGDNLAIFKEEFKDDVEKDNCQLLAGAFLPDRAVAVNEPWKLDRNDIAKQVLAVWEMSIDTSKSSASGKLLKAYMNGGKQFGVFEIQVNLAPRKIVAAGTPIELESGSKVKLLIRFDGCIDGTQDTAKMSMIAETTMKGVMKIEGLEVKMDSSVKKTVAMTLEEVKKR